MYFILGKKQNLFEILLVLVNFSNEQKQTFKLQYLQCKKLKFSPNELSMNLKRFAIDLRESFATKPGVKLR